MTRFDFTPYRRSFVGFDRVFDALENATAHVSDNYPPFNIERIDANAYRITIAVAGFKADEIDITAQQNQLLVKGSKAQSAEQDRSRFVHLGIATRNFERRFDLADFVRVTGANIADGLLTIELLREIPEALKPQKIAIGTAAPETPVIDVQPEASEASEDKAAA
ncbi:Hsp20 family protein [Sphingomonas lacunae]|uniref:Hsp20 family protein n=1 Tax=Sphingomonas lacunae TaxID=2698828 RepID=A0A6M4AWS9_9SPHN|nr:Hsp20 family protein [Sphingomonas lacunae]QJQ32830.1 Hsp20 family protein [Sphingomonas lacunae]